MEEYNQENIDDFMEREKHYKQKIEQIKLKILTTLKILQKMYLKQKNKLQYHLIPRQQ